MVMLELLELAINAMQHYATKFKNDGITQEQVLGLYERVTGYLGEIEPSTELTAQKKQKIEQLLDDTDQAVRLAYET